jgi:tetratricopeptide (TPR) repeat protein
MRDEMKSFSLFVFTLVCGAVVTLSLPGSADARRDDQPPENFSVSFSPNPPSKQYDLAATGRKNRIIINKVQKAHLGPGVECLEQARYWCAHQNLDFVLRWIPNHGRALDLYSQLAIARGRPESVIPYLDYALRFDHDNPALPVVYGIHRYRTGDFEAAAERFRQALNRNSESAEAHYHLGLSLAELGRWEAAREHAHRAYDLGYPLPGLREKLRREGEWRPTSAKP